MQEEGWTIQMLIFNIINPIQEFGLSDKFKMVSSPETEIRWLKFSRNINSVDNFL